MKGTDALPLYVPRRQNHPILMASTMARIPRKEYHDEDEMTDPLCFSSSRRNLLFSIMTTTTTTIFQQVAMAEEEEEDGGTGSIQEVQVLPTGDVKKIFNEGRAYELQGNVAAAQRLYIKVTRIAPRFIYGWSNLGNTQVAFGDLDNADRSYTSAIDLCNENIRFSQQQKQQQQFGVRQCDDLYVLLLNRGTVRLNNKQTKEALVDLEMANTLRSKPDSTILQNLARAHELNGQYTKADQEYTLAISMTSNEVNPFWLRSSLMKFQLGDLNGAFGLVQRVERRFPDASEVKVAKAAMMWKKGDDIGARQTLLQIPDRQQLKYMDENFLRTVIVWPPAMIENVLRVYKAIADADAGMSDGDNNNNSATTADIAQPQ